MKSRNPMKVTFQLRISKISLYWQIFKIITYQTEATNYVLFLFSVFINIFFYFFEPQIEIIEITKYWTFMNWRPLSILNFVSDHKSVSYDQTQSKLTKIVINLKYDIYWSMP